MARRKISQATVARHLGMSQPAVYRRLAGVVPFDVNELQAVADLLEVPTSTLLADEPTAAAVTS